MMLKSCFWLQGKLRAETEEVKSDQQASRSRNEGAVNKNSNRSFPLVFKALAQRGQGKLSLTSSAHLP